MLMTNNEFNGIVGKMRNHAYTPLDEFEDYLNDLLDRDRITYKESVKLFDLAVKIVDYYYNYVE